MKITILCSSARHPIFSHLEMFCKQNEINHDVELVQTASKLLGGDVLFLVSCHEILTKAVRDRFEKVLVLHASDLPAGKGWSPHIWQIIEGKTNIVVTLLEAADSIDSGDIVAREMVEIPSTALHDEIHQLLFDAEIRLMQNFIDSPENYSAQQQDKTIESTYYSKRGPKDSKLDVNRTILEQFDLIRVCDPSRYPCYFEVHDQKFKITIERFDPDADV